MSMQNIRFMRFVAKVAFGCWEWQGFRLRDEYGSLTYGLFTFGVGDRCSSHRASWRLFRGQIPNGAFVLHRCDNCACVNPDHLFLGDALANSRDMVSKGRSVKGEAHPLSKLTDAAVREIRASAETSRALAERFGASRRVVALARSGKTWRHV